MSEQIALIPASRRYPKEISRVVSSARLRSAENPDSCLKASRYYGRQFTKIWGDPVYVVSQPQVDNKTDEIISTTSLPRVAVGKLFTLISDKASKYFYQNGVFYLDAYFDLWSAVCQGEKLLLGNKRDNLLIESTVMRDIEDSLRQHTHEAILEKICSPLTGSPDKIAKWYNFSIDCEIDKLLEGEEYTELLVQYCGGLSCDYRLCLHQHHNLEADYYIAIARKEQPSWRRKPETVAILGVRQVNATTWSVENLQGKVKAKHAFRDERSNLTDSLGYPMYSELREFNWRKLLIFTTEELAKSLGIELMLFRSGQDNYHYNQYKNGADAKYDTNFIIRYDGTARQTGYKKQIDANGKTVYVKYLVLEIDLDMEITLPRHRPGDGFIMH